MNFFYEPKLIYTVLLLVNNSLPAQLLTAKQSAWNST